MASKQYLVRPYEPADRERFLSLYEAVWGYTKGREWFDWRFRENPYRDGVQMIVAESDGRLVGAEPVLPFRLQIGSRTVDAYQPVDWIVHPDHRRRGVFSRMTERLLDHYGDDAALLFNFPNDALLPGLKQFGWREVGRFPTGYRVQDPRPLLADSTTSPAGAVLRPVLTVVKTLTKGGLAVLDRVNAPPDSVTVERYSGVPDSLERLYASAPPERIHVPRDRGFLDWRFGNPRWETTTYVASHGGDPVASVVAATERHHDGSVTTTLLDLQPMAGGEAASSAVESLFVGMLRDSRDADLVKVPGWLDSRLRRRYGFWRDTTISLSRLPHVSRVAVRPLDLDRPDPWHIDGRDLTDDENWLLTMADLDIE